MMVNYGILRLTDWLWIRTKGKQTMISYYKRQVDCGNGTQYVEVLNGMIRQQWLASNGNHSYTGDGNPELVGQPQSAMRGYGFKKCNESEKNRLLETTE